MPPGWVVWFAIVSVLSMLRAEASQDFFKKGLESYENERYGEAEGHFKKALDAGDPTAELRYYLGMCAALQGRLSEAERQFLGALKINPALAGAYLELGGVFLKQKRYAEAEAAVKNARRMSPGDAYVHDLLGTLYFIRGKQTHALIEWNKVSKPIFHRLFMEDVPGSYQERIRNELSFKEGQFIRPSQVEESRQRLQRVDCISYVSFDLVPRPEAAGQFDVLFTGHVERGFGGGPADVLLSGLRDIYRQTVHVQYKNIAGRFVNIYSTFRWDAHRKKTLLALTIPRLLRTPCYYRFSFRDQRDWWLFDQSEALPTGQEFTVAVKEIRADLEYISSSRLSLAHRLRGKRTTYRPVASGEAGPATHDLLWGGRYAWRWIDSQEHLFSSELIFDWDVSSRKLGSSRGYSKFAIAWNISKSGPGNSSVERKYQLRGQGTFGYGTAATPFDEFFVLGVGPDVDHELRAYDLTQSGKLGNCPLGRKFLLGNLEYRRALGRLSVLSFEGGIFVDGGKVLDDNPFNTRFGNTFLADCGILIEVRVLSVSLIFSYAHSLSGRVQSFTISSRPWQART